MGYKSTNPDSPTNKKAIELYQSGMPIEEIADAVFLSVSGLRYRLRVMGLEPRDVRIPPEVIEQIRKERRSGKSYKEIKNVCKVGYETAVKYSKDIKVTVKRGRKDLPTLDDPIIQKALEIYRGGANLAATAQAVNLSFEGLRHRFKVLGIPMREPGRKRITPEQIEIIRCEYKSGKSFHRIAKEMGITPPTVRKYAK